MWPEQWKHANAFIVPTKDLTLKHALETAQAMEEANNNAKTLQAYESAFVNQFINPSHGVGTLASQLLV